MSIFVKRNRFLNHAHTHADNITLVTRQKETLQTKNALALTRTCRLPNAWVVKETNEQTENKRKYKKKHQQIRVFLIDAENTYARQMISSIPSQCSSASNSRDAFHTLRSAQVTHDAPPHCQTLGPILCRRIYRSQHQPSCSEPIPTYRMTHTS